jgi:phage terminase small subunit
MAKGLTRKQELFIAEYLIDLNATNAAIRAGYKENSARQQGASLLSKPDISAEISKKQGKNLEKHDISADRVLQELARIAYSDRRKCLESDGSLKRMQDFDDDVAACIAGFEVIELFEGSGDKKHAYGLLKKVKLASKLTALDLLGKHLKLFGESSQNAINIGIQLVHSIPQPKQEET